MFSGCTKAHFIFSRADAEVTETGHHVISTQTVLSEHELYLTVSTESDEAVS